jgi:Fe2+ transport system protein FeoA
MCLSDAEKGKKLRVLEILSNDQLIRKLNSIGIHIDDVIVKHNDTAWGPVLVSMESNESSKLALGRELAEKISVTYEL